MERCRQAPIRGWPKTILMLLAYHHNPKTGQCDPSVVTLAVESGAHHETVTAALVELKRLGVISARRRGPTSSAYTIHFEVFDDPGFFRGHLNRKAPEKAGGLSTPSPRKNRQMTPEKPVNDPGKPGPKPKEPKEPKSGADAAGAAKLRRPAASPQSQSEIATVAARASERSLALAHAHAAGREGHELESEARHDRATRRPVRNGKHQPEAAPMTDRPNAWLIDMDWLIDHVPAKVIDACRAMLAPHLPTEAVEWMLVELAAFASFEGVLPDYRLAVAALAEGMATAAALGVPVEEVPAGHHGRRFASVLERKRAASEAPPAKAVELDEEPAAAPQTVEEIIASLGTPTPAEERTMRIYEHRHHGKPWQHSWGPHPDLDAEPAAVKPADPSAEGGDK